METEKVLADAWYNMKQKKEKQWNFILDSSQLVEIYAADHSISGPNVEIELRYRYNPERLFSKVLLCNNSLFKKLRT